MPRGVVLKFGAALITEQSQDAIHMGEPVCDGAASPVMGSKFARQLRALFDQRCYHMGIGHGFHCGRKLLYSLGALAT